MEFVEISHLSYPLIGKWTHILEVKEYMLASFTGHHMRLLWIIFWLPFSGYCQKMVLGGFYMGT